jgi:hypothetical protein
MAPGQHRSVSGQWRRYCRFLQPPGAHCGELPCDVFRRSGGGCPACPSKTPYRGLSVSVQPTTSLTSGGEFELQVIAKRKELTEEEVRLASLSIANPSSLKEISIDLKCNKARQRTAEAMRRIISRIDVRSAINPRHGLGVVARSGHGFRA